jgi:MraZ protein
MFRGNSKLTVDAKGRLAVPKHHRDRLETDGITGLMVTADPSHCLLIYPMPDWLEIETKLMSLPNTDPHVRAMQRLYVGYATETEFDVNGRILLPEVLREYASIGKKARLIGQGKKFELWGEEAYQASSEQWPSDINDLDVSERPLAIQQLSI